MDKRVIIAVLGALCIVLLGTLIFKENHYKKQNEEGQTSFQKINNTPSDVPKTHEEKRIIRNQLPYQVEVKQKQVLKGTFSNQSNYVVHDIIIAVSILDKEGNFITRRDIRAGACGPNVIKEIDFEDQFVEIPLNTKMKIKQVKCDDLDFWIDTDKRIAKGGVSGNKTDPWYYRNPNLVNIQLK